MDTLKTCRRCELELELDAFGRDRTRADGRFPYCRACKKKNGRSDYLKHRTERLAKSAERYAANPAPAIARARRAYAADPERAKARAVAWNRENLERRTEIRRGWEKRNRHELAAKRRTPEARAKVSERGAAWRAANPERVRQNARLSLANRRARWRNAERRLVTRRDVRRLWTRQRGRCAYCEAELESSAHLEHVQPLARGGRHAIGNLVWACEACNLSKGPKFVVEWRLAA